MMVMDEGGHGQSVLHFMVEVNSEWHMRRAIEGFQESSATSNEIQVVVVDENLSKANVLIDMLPRARVFTLPFPLPEVPKEGRS